VATFQSDDAWEMACPACRALPTIRFTLVANDKYGAPYTVLSGRTVQGGKHAATNPNRGITPYDTIRRWAADALAHGATNLRLEMERHTRNLGWSSHERFTRTGTVYKITKLTNIKPLAFGEAA
jgi:hypothetical protein